MLRSTTLVTITYLAFRFFLVDYVWSPLRWISDLLSLSLGGLVALALLKDPAWRRAAWPARGGLRHLLLLLAGAIALAVVTVLASGLANGRGLMDIATGIRSLVLWSTLLAAAGLIAAWEVVYGPSEGGAAGMGQWVSRAVGWVISLAVFMAVVEIAGVLLFGWYGPAEWVATLTGANAGRAVGLMKNPNTLGCFLVLGLLLLWPRWAGAVARRAHDWAAWTWAILLIMGLALTYSRQGWLATTTGLVAAGWVARRAVPWRVTVVLLIVAVVVTVITTMLPVPLLAWADDDGGSMMRQVQWRRISETFDEETVDKSRATGRLAMVRYALAMLRDHPVLGVGPGRVGGAGALHPDEELRE
ncbi:MAG TPA: O-antigen ligase family protein, partial [Thermaerobacter sp.]